MRECLYQLESYLHQLNEHPPLMRLAWIHYQFEAIHPFIDGNGRIGRLLIILLMVHWNLLPSPLLYLSDYFERHRSEYYNRLQAVSEHGAWHEWTLFFLRGVQEQAQKAVKVIHALQDLYAQWRQYVEEAGIRSRVVYAALDLLMERHVITARELEKRANCSHVSAYRVLETLEQLKILSLKYTGRPRLYVAHEALRILRAV